MEAELEGLCECGYKKAKPEGPFCPKCTAPLFMRPANTRPTPGTAASLKVDDWLQTLDNLSSRLSVVGVEEQRAAAGIDPNTPVLAANIPAGTSHVKVMFGDREVEYARVGHANEAIVDRRDATNPHTTTANPTSNDNTSHHKGNLEHYEAQRGRTTSPAKCEESAPPFWRVTSLGQIRIGERSRSPRREDDRRDTQRVRSRAGSRRLISPIRSQSRPPLQELTGVNILPIKRRRGYNEPQRSKTVTLGPEVAKLVPVGGLQRHRPGHREERQSHAGDTLQQDVSVTPAEAEARPLGNSHSVQPEPPALREQNSHRLPMDAVPSDLAASVQQLLDEEKARVDEGLPQHTTNTPQHDGQAQITVDEGRLPQGTAISRQVETQGELAEIANSPQLNEAPRKHRDPPSAPLSNADTLNQGAQIRDQGENQDAWCLICHRRGHSTHSTCPPQNARRAVAKIERDWSLYYQRDAVAGIRKPRTVDQVINIAFRLAKEFDKLNDFVVQRDAYLLEIDQYLKSRVSTASYEAWQTCLNMCTITVDMFMDRLVRMLTDFQFHVVLKALYHAAKTRTDIGANIRKCHVADLSREEQAELMECTKEFHHCIKIPLSSYTKSMGTLNSARDAYLRHYDDAANRVWIVLRRNREAQQSKKIRRAFTDLSSTMLDAGMQAKLDVMSPSDFALPNIQRLRDDFEALADAER